jgi:hypothetical protein
MVSFKRFFTEGHYKLTDSERNQISSLANLYINKFKENGPTKDITLGSIKCLDLETNKDVTITVNLSPNSSQIGGKYNEDTKTITLYFGDTGLINADRVFDMIAHEVYHAKQQYKKAGDEYEMYSPEKEKEHFTHPTEYPVYVSTLVDSINRYFVSIVHKLYNSEGSIREMWSRKKEEFMLFLKIFLKAGGELPTEITVPDVLKRYEKFINFLVKHKDEQDVHQRYQRFFKTVYKTYTELKDYDER